MLSFWPSVQAAPWAQDGTILLDFQSAIAACWYFG
jgi:hypothetical protein